MTPIGDTILRSLPAAADKSGVQPHIVTMFERGFSLDEKSLRCSFVEQ